MAVRYYDEALYNKIQKWVKDPNMRILKPDEVSRLFRITADLNKDKPITLPLIAISRDTSINVDITSKRSLSASGLKVGGDETKTIQLNAIPITVMYQIDIYTKRYEEGDEYLRNFIFNLVNYPKLTITIPYNDSNIEQVAHIRLQPTVTDNSDIPERLFPGQFTRWTLQLELQDAYLFSVPFNKNWSIDVDSTVNSEILGPSGESLEDYRVEAELDMDGAHNGFTHISEKDLS